MAQTATAYAIQQPVKPNITVYRNDPPTFSADYVAEFISYVDRKPTTTKTYISCLRQFIKWAFDNVPDIEHICRDDIKAYRNHLASCGLKETTQSQYLRATKQFFAWLSVEHGYPDIARNVHGAKVSKGHKRDKIPPEACEGIAASIDRTTEQGKRLYAMWMVATTVGTRCIELHRANVCDVKTMNGLTWFYVWGKGHDAPDTPVLLEAPVAEAVREYLDARTEPTRPKSPLFTATGNRNRGGRIAATTISQMIKRLLKANGYDSDRITAHSIRKTVATASIESGQDLYSTQKLMRHEKPDTTEIYIQENDALANEITGRAAIYNYIYNGGVEVTPVLPELQATLQAMSLDEQRALLATIQKGGE